MCGFRSNAMWYKTIAITNRLIAARAVPGSITSGLSCCVLPGHGSFRGLLNVTAEAAAGGPISRSLTENALDCVHRNSVHPGHLGSSHAVLYPGTDASKLRARDLDRRYRRLGGDLCGTFLMTDRRCRQRSQNTRFPRRLVDRCLGVRNCSLSDWLF